MHEYIEKDDAKHLLCELCNSVNSDAPCEPDDCEFIAMIDNFVHTDVSPVRNGRWNCTNKAYGEYECSVCLGRDSDCSDYYGAHVVTEQEYCPNCGAKMDGGDADGTGS